MKKGWLNLYDVLHPSIHPPPNWQPVGCPGTVIFETREEADQFGAIEETKGFRRRIACIQVEVPIKEALS